MKTIEISENVYKSLADLAIGFEDTPNSVIERLLTAFSNKVRSQSLPSDLMTNLNLKISSLETKRLRWRYLKKIALLKF